MIDKQLFLLAAFRYRTIVPLKVLYDSAKLNVTLSAIGILLI